jgi:tRNA(Glu) U13 pseudouridine synthase TruD
VLGRGAYATVFLGRHVKTAKVNPSVLGNYY